MTLRRLCRAVGAVFLVGFLLIAFTPLVNVAYGRLLVQPAVAPAEAIVVLGGGSEPDGTLLTASLRRTVEGIRLARLGLAPLIVMCGPRPPAGGPSEGSVRAELARTFGVPPEAILVEDTPLTTREEAQRVRDRLLRGRGVRRILLVTGTHHMARARALFVREGFEVVPAADAEVLATADRPGARLDLFRAFVQEFLGQVYYRAAGYL